MKICIDARMIEHAGIGVVIKNILSMWIRNHPENEYVVLLPSTKMTRYEWMEKTYVVRVPWDAGIYSIKEHFSWQVAKLKCDIAWVPHFNVSKSFRGRVVCTIHDILHIEQHIIKRSLIQRLYAHYMLRWAKWRSKGVVFDSEATRQAFTRRIGNIAGEIVVWCGVEKQWFDESKILNTQQPYIVFVGSVFRHKNLTRLIQAIQIVRESENVTLKVIGNFESIRNGDLEAVALAAKLPQSIEMLGKISFDDLQSTIQGAQALVSPSLYEGFGLPPLEALAKGVPVVVSDIPVYRELYEGIAIFVDPNSATSIANGILRVLRTGAAKEDCKEFARKYDWEIASEKYLQFLSDCTCRK